MLLLERKADLTPISNSLIESCPTFLDAGFFMFWLAITYIFSAILELIHIGRLSEQDKDLEIMILRHQLDVMTRLQSKPVKPNRAEKLTFHFFTLPYSQSVVLCDMMDKSHLLSLGQIQ
jgi:hypothetical protein